MKMVFVVFGKGYVELFVYVLRYFIRVGLVEGNFR